jgi:hypothetical protein
MPLIDQKYFVGELDIPNTDRPEVQERLNLFIAKYENELLYDLFGYQLHRDFLAGLEVNPIAEKWTNLRDGVEYTNRYGRLTKWRGLITPDRYESPIASYVYYFWNKDTYTQSVGIGEVKTKAENATVVSPMYKMIRAWNEMVKAVHELRYFLDDPSMSYAGWSSFYSQRLARKYDFINQFGI